jgi:hypothetical protein
VLLAQIPTLKQPTRHLSGGRSPRWRRRAIGRTLFLSLVLLPWAPLAARADYVHPTLAARAGTIVELRVNDGAASVLIEIDQKDEAYFANLTGGTNKQTLSAGTIKETIQPFQLLDADSGRPMNGRVESVSVQPRTIRYDTMAPPPVDVRGKPLPLPEVSPLVTAVRLTYPLRGAPGGVVVVPPRRTDESTAALSIGSIAFHEGLPLTNYWYLSQPETLRLRWDDPWQSAFTNRNLKRPHASSASAYLTIEPYEVRHEIVVRLKDLAPALGLSLPASQPLGEADRQRVIQAAEALFTARPLTSVDGQRVAAAPEAIQFLTVDARGVLQQATASTALRPFSTLLGVSLSYPASSLPQKVTVDWDLFSDELPSVAAMVTDPAGPFPYVLTPDSPRLEWTNSLKASALAVPTPVRVERPAAAWLWLALALCLGMAALLAFRRHRPRLAVLVAMAWLPLLILQRTPALGATLWLSDQQAGRLIEQLLRNVYRSMELKQESRVHDQLALSLSEDLLSEVYVEQRRLLRSQQDGGATTRIRSVQVTQLEPLRIDRLGGEAAYRVSWLASGLVSHWGHTHQRRLRYQANLILQADQDRWTITGLTLLDEARL